LWQTKNFFNVARAAGDRTRNLLDSLFRRTTVAPNAGLLDFSWCYIPIRGENIPNDHKIFQKAIKYSKWP
jgi:hypothetical protein